jgi:aminopeptidase YwaD
VGNRFRSSGIALGLAIAVISCPVGKTSAADLGETLKAHVMYLASDSLEGRLPGTPGIEDAASYIVAEFEEIGLEPVFDGAFHQEFEMELGMEVEMGPFLQQYTYCPPADSRCLAALPISGSGAAKGEWVSGLPEDRDITGFVVFHDIDPEIEQDRWTMIGRDGLLDWMRDVSVRAEERGAAGIVFVSGWRQGDRASRLHTFPVQRAYRPVGIPALELMYAEFGKTGPCAGLRSSFAQPDPTLTCSLAVVIEPRLIEVSNVAGMLRGASDAGECMVVGAHYDHLGYGDIASSTPWRREIHNGADDNASGTAALIEIARRIAAGDPPERSIVFVCFTAEELGALGSEYYCKHPPFPIDSTIAMINLDTVGRLEEDRLIIFGARSAAEFSDVIREVNETHLLEPIEKKEIYGFSDQNPFYARGIPSLHFFTGAYDDYHSPDDDWQNLDYEGLSAVTAFVTDFTLALASLPEVTPVVDAEEEPLPVMSRGKGAFLGIIPDFAYGGTGVGLKGIVPKSPAEAAGLLDGDVIVAIDDKPIADLQGLMHFLVSRNPGDEIEIRIMRGSSPAVKKATLSVRSSQAK